MKAREPETQETFDDGFSTIELDARRIAEKIDVVNADCRKAMADRVRGLFLKHGYFNGRAEGFCNHEGSDITVRWVLSCYGLPNHLDIEDMIEEIKSVLSLMDGLAEQWGDEGVFRRCRDRLRALVQPIPRGQNG